jgi:sec-independent protein translocase protein TatA
MDAVPNGFGVARKTKPKNFKMQLNPMLAIFNLGGGEIILILAIVLILFGAKKLPELAKGLGQGIKEFKKATDNASAGMRQVLEETSPSMRLFAAAPPAAPSKDTLAGPALCPEPQASPDGQSSSPKPAS